MKNKRQRRIGVIGGMGPDASAYLYAALIKKAREEYRVSKNEEYPEILLHSLPVTDFTQDTSTLMQATHLLLESTQYLSSKCSVLCLACNTAHVLIDQLQSTTDTPFLSMIECVAKRTIESQYAKIGLLATQTTYETGLYQDAFENSQIDVLVPTDDDRQLLGNVISDIIAGKTNSSREKLESIADKLVANGAEAIILGCTELPLVFSNTYTVPVLSSLDILADELLNVYYAK